MAANSSSTSGPRPFGPLPSAYDQVSSSGPGRNSATPVSKKAAPTNGAFKRARDPRSRSRSPSPDRIGLWRNYRSRGDSCESTSTRDSSVEDFSYPRRSPTGSGRSSAQSSYPEPDGHNARPMASPVPEPQPTATTPAQPAAEPDSPEPSYTLHQALEDEDISLLPCDLNSTTYETHIKALHDDYIKGLKAKKLLLLWYALIGDTSIHIGHIPELNVLIKEEEYLSRRGKEMVDRKLRDISESPEAEGYESSTGDTNPPSPSKGKGRAATPGAGTSNGQDSNTGQQKTSQNESKGVKESISGDSTPTAAKNKRHKKKRSPSVEEIREPIPQSQRKKINPVSRTNRQAAPSQPTQSSAAQASSKRGREGPEGVNDSTGLEKAAKKSRVYIDLTNSSAPTSRLCTPAPEPAQPVPPAPSAPEQTVPTATDSTTPYAADSAATTAKKRTMGDQAAEDEEYAERHATPAPSVAPNLSAHSRKRMASPPSAKRTRTASPKATVRPRAARPSASVPPMVQKRGRKDLSDTETEGEPKEGFLTAGNKKLKKRADLAPRPSVLGKRHRHSSRQRVKKGPTKRTRHEYVQDEEDLPEYEPSDADENEVPNEGENENDEFYDAETGEEDEGECEGDSEGAENGEEPEAEKPAEEKDAGASKISEEADAAEGVPQPEEL